MRKEKFDNSKDSYDNDDIKYAFECNSLSDKLELIDVIVAEVCGENDGYPWYWILQMKDGTFAHAEGSCDYTGWDCQSGAQFNGGFKTAGDALEALEVDDYDSRKNIKWCLEMQLAEKIPFAIYQEDQSLTPITKDTTPKQ